MLQQIIDIVSNAQSEKAPIARLADRIATVFVPIVVIIAAAVFCRWYFFADKGNLAQAVNCVCATLVIACPCALGLATPTAIMTGSGRAAELGMKDTVYVNCTGLPAAGQQTTARDILRVSCEICRHPAYFNYSSLWLSNLTHPSGRVTDLTNTNRLVRFYADCDGLKTGSTNEAKYCVSATAQRSGMRLIAIVLGAPASQTRFNEARAMMDYGFATYRRTQVIAAGELTGYAIPVRRGAQDTAPIAVGKGLSMLLRAGQADKLSVELNLPESIEAPQTAGTRVGDVRVLLDGQTVAELPAVLAQDVRLPGFLEGLLLMLDHWR